MATHISIIAALGKNREIGKEGKLLWNIPEDLKRFKQLTMGHAIIMGRKTFESIGKPLPERTNIVLSRRNLDIPEVLKASSIEETLAKAREIDREEIFIIGGAEIYAQTLPLADRLYLTLIEDQKEADAFFPVYEHLFTKKISEESRKWNGLKYAWVTLEK